MRLITAQSFFRVRVVLPLLLAMITVSAAGCSGHSRSLGERNVFFINTHVSFNGPVDRSELVGIVFQYKNLTSNTVRMLSMSIEPPVPGVQVVSIAAYNSDRTAGFPAMLLGNMQKLCPEDFVPSPLRALVVAPHASSTWYSVVTIRMQHPGNYTIGKVKLMFVTSGRHGWQYQNADVTLQVRNEPPPRTTHWCP